jgi:hypothetical protein
MKAIRNGCELCNSGIYVVVSPVGFKSRPAHNGEASVEAFEWHS